MSWWGCGGVGLWWRADVAAISSNQYPLNLSGLLLE